MNLTAGLGGGQLQIGFAYSKAIHHQNTIEKLAQGYLDALRQIIKHCTQPEAGGYTVSDFPYIAIEQPVLDDWLGNNRNVEDVYPATPMQQGMLFHSLAMPGSGVYVEVMGCRLEGELSADAFEKAWQLVVNRHSILRTGFVWDKTDEPIQIVSRQLDIHLERLDWRNDDPSDQQKRLNRLVQSGRAKGFDLSKAPLMRLILIQMGADQWQFVWLHHHLLLDGWSLPVLLKEVFGCYEALSLKQEINLPMSKPYRDYILWLVKQDMKEAENFWRETMQGFTTPTPFFVDTLPKQPDATDAESKGKQHYFIDEALTQKLNGLVKMQKLTLNTLLQGAWSVLLNRYSGEDDILFGAVVSGRPAELAGIDNMVGLFINTLPVRVSFDKTQTLQACLQKLQVNQVDQRQYEYTPLAKIQQWSQIEPGLPMFESLLVFENFPVDRVLNSQQQGSVRITDVMAHEQTNFPLTLVVSPGKQISLDLSYDPERFQPAMIERLLQHLEMILKAFPAYLKRPVTDIPLLTSNEYLQIVTEWNDSAKDYQAPDCLHDLFEQQVEKTPTVIALEYDDATMTYQQLNEKANQLAHYLVSQGVRPGMMVGVFALRSFEMVLALYAIIKAGGAYLPLDPTYPADHLRYYVLT